MTDRNDSWGSTADKVQGAPRGYGHLRQESGASVSSVTDYKYHQRTASFGNVGYGGYDPQPYHPNHRPSRSDSFPDQPVHAHTQDPGPTPQFSESYYTGNAAANLEKPERSQSHPGAS